MEKISRIIPASSRTQSAEISDSQPARPGAPAMGRVMGRVTQRSFSQEYPQGVPKDTISIGESRVPDFAGYKNLKDVRTATQGLDREIEKNNFADNGIDDDTRATTVKTSSTESAAATAKSADKSEVKASKGQEKEADNVKVVDGLAKKFFLSNKTAIDEAKGDDSNERVADAIVTRETTKKKQPLSLYDSSDLRQTALKEKEAQKDKTENKKV